MAEAVRFSDSVMVRCQPQVTAAVERAAIARGQKPAEYVRQAILTGLRLDGFDPAAMTARDAGSLYNAVAGLRHWALVVDGAIKATHRAAEQPTADDALPHVGVWLPIEYQDSEPFHDDRHWRLPYETTIEAGRVVRTYPVIVKSLEAL